MPQGPGPGVMLLAGVVAASLILLAYQGFRRMRGPAVRALEEREERLRLALAAADQGVFEWTLATGELRCDRRAQEILGFEPGAFPGTMEACLATVHPEDRPEARERIRRFLEEGGGEEGRPGEHRILTPAGEVRWIAVLGRAYRDAGGKPVRVVGTVREVTDRKRMEAELEAGQRLTQAFLHHSPMGEVILDIEEPFPLLAANPAFAAWSGLPAGDHLGRPPEEIVPREVFLQHLPAVREVVKTGAPQVVKTLTRDPEGNPLYAWTQYFLIRGAGGEPVAIGGVIVDQTRERNALLEARAQRDRAQLYLDTAQTILLALDREGRIEMMNHVGCQLLGCGHPAGEGGCLGEDWFQSFLPPGEVKAAREVFRRLVAGEGALAEAHESCVVTATGETRLVAWRSTAVRGADGGIAGTLSSGRDITAERAREEALRESLEWQEAITEGSLDAIFVSDADSRFVRVNQAASDLTGYSREELLGMRIPDLHEEVDLHAYRRYHARIMAGERILSGAKILRKDGRRVDTEFNNQRVIIGGTPYLHTVARDITGRREAERALRTSQERFRALAARVEGVREEERRALARELHDELGQALTALRIDLRLLRSGLPGAEPAARKALDDLVASVDQTMELVRGVTARLRPPMLDHLGLGAAVEWLAEESCGRAGISLDLDLSLGEEGVSPALATAAFRIVQESLTNVLRHASAGRVWVSLRTEGPELAGEVRDDGVGITETDLDALPATGILGMQERARSLGGSLSVAPDPEGGARVSFRIPLGNAGARNDGEGP